MGDASMFIGASEMCDCGYFSSFSFYFYFLFDPYSCGINRFAINQLFFIDTFVDNKHTTS